MPFDPKRTRRIFLAIAVLLIAVVLGFYSYARWKVNQALSKLPEKLGVEVQQSTAGFTFTKSDNGHKQFSISAAKAIQYKKGQKASLRNVRIIVYGRGVSGSAQEGVYDQIYGDEFEYDPNSGQVRANGVVHIDLANRGTPSEDPSRLDVDPDSIHLWTSGLVFNQKSGIAETKEKVEFSIPQATGSARGAHYDSKSMTLDFVADVDVTTRVPPAPAHKKSVMGVSHVHARSAHITNSPRRAELADVIIEQGERSMLASSVQVFLQGNSTIDHVEAAALHARDADPKKGTELMARIADFRFGANNTLASANLTGPVEFSSLAGGGLMGSAGRAEIAFGPGNVVRDLRAGDNVTVEQKDASGQPSTLHAAALDFNVKSGKIISAATQGRSEIALAGGTRIQADRFQADFAANNQISQIRGAPHAIVILSGQHGQSTSTEVVARFATARRGSPLQWVEQNGDFRYVEGERKASAEHARYVPKDQTLTATGNPRFEDGSAGLAVSANTLRFHRTSDSVDADGNVKATYSAQKNPGDGALLGSEEPVHVTSVRATATTAGKALFTGDARLWQGASIIEGATVEFDRKAAVVVATASPGRPVQVNFTQTDAKGKQVPVTITAGKLVYNDAQRRAVFSAPVRAVGQETAMSARQMDVLLKPHSQSSQAGGVLDQIIASGNVQLEQRNPSRKASGNKLTYFAGPGKFVLSSAAGETASIFDAEHGQIQADSLTFFTHDDTVQVGSGEKARVVTTTRIKEDSRP